MTTQEHTWTEEFTVRGEEVMATVEDLFRQVTVHRIQVKKQNGDVLFDIPLVAGVAGVAMIGPWAALALLAAWVADLVIVVERSAPAKAAAADETATVDQCQGLTKSGAQCKRRPMTGSTYCAQHQPG